MTISLLCIFILNGTDYLIMPNIQEPCLQVKKAVIQRLALLIDAFFATNNFVLQRKLFDTFIAINRLCVG